MDDDRKRGEPMETLEARLLESDRVGRGMAQWREERPDIDCSGKAVIGRVLHLHDVILRSANRVLQRHGLKYPTYAVLATLRVAGAPYRMSPSELSETLLLSSGGLSNLLRRMEKEGYIARSPDKRDRRGVIVQLTQKGIAKADQSMADHAAIERSLVGCLPPERQLEVARALGLMIAVAER
ncbi:MAG TPA: MarR family transcriptional regulator [Rhizobiaceae bacterium]|nr:MarR family transcriptional regulator [Rhizobiaceae bacterium]